MVLNKVKGNMYSFMNFTWNTLLGRCIHNCDYCYNKGKPFFDGDLRFNEKNLNDDLGENNFIFIGSSNDLFADKVPKEWIIRTLEHCKKYNNKYLFQTKNPARFREFIDFFNAMDCILGTTIETNRWTRIISNAPLTYERKEAMKNLDFDTMVSIEPIIDCDINIMVEWMKEIKPKFVSIGADSKNNNLPEPSKEDVDKLVNELKTFTDVKVKENLKRLLK